MDFKVSAKLQSGKWFNFGRIKEGKYGPQLSFKNSAQFKEFVNNGGEWLNFSLFVPDEKREPREIAPDTQAMLEQLKASALNDEEIPF